ncbi:MAG: inositol monophosphatase family protein [bacterium]
MDFNQILQTVKPKVVEVGDYVYRNWSKITIDEIHADGVDMSTNFDKSIAKELRNFLEICYPAIPIFDEETAPESNYFDNYAWSIDPIDGTKYFSKLFPMWTISIALLHKRKPVLGIIYLPASQQCYYAVKGSGVFNNGILLKKPAAVENNKATISWDLPLNQAQYKIINDTSLKMDWKTLQQKNNSFLIKTIGDSYRVRILGNGSISLMGLCTGLFHAYLSPMREKMKFHDLAAGLIIAEELGCKIKIYSISDKFEQVIVTNLQEEIELEY